MRRVVTLAGIAVLVVACARPEPIPASIESPGAGGAPGGTQAAGEPVSATNQAEGVLVSIALSSGTVAGGDRIMLRVSATNIGLDEVTYESGGCGATGTIVFEGQGDVQGGEVDAPPAGTTPADVLALARWSALAQGGPGLDWIRQPGMPEGAEMGCPANLAFDQLGTGESVQGEWEWVARTSDGAPAAPGTYGIRYTFPFVARGRVEPDADGGMPRPPAQPSVLIPIRVTPGAAVAVSAAQAIDAAIADPEVLAWASRRLTRREDITGGGITMADGAWRFTIGLNGGEAVIDVDPVTGEVTGRQLP